MWLKYCIEFWPLPKCRLPPTQCTVWISLLLSCSACLPKSQRMNGNEEWRQCCGMKMLEYPAVLNERACGLSGWLCSTLELFDAELCLERERGEQGEICGGSLEMRPGEGQMENRQTERQRGNLCLSDSVSLSSSVSICPSLHLSIYLYHIPPLVCPSPFFSLLEHTHTPSPCETYRDTQMNEWMCVHNCYVIYFYLS